MSAQTLASISADVVPPMAAPTIVVEQPAVVASQTTIMKHVNRNAVWVFIVVAIIVLIIIFWVGKCGMQWYNNLNHSWSCMKGGNMVVWAVLFVIIVLLAAYVSGRAYSMANHSTRTGIAVTFGLSMLFLLIWFGVFFSKQCVKSSVWFGVIALILAILWTYYVFKANRSCGWGMLPYLIWVIAVLGFTCSLRKSDCDDSE